ncbi:protein-tyrosine phosphatase-like protein [Mycena crocata]|nr:protein-tyrosine phosphatase-like protein [Mycena crocata]
MIRFDQLPPAVVKAMCIPMHQILPSTEHSGALYLGSLAAVIDPTLLRTHGISRIVQVLEPQFAPQQDDFAVYNIDISDTESTDLLPHLEPACKYIEHALKGRENILIHCHQGVSRSASILIAYLIHTHAMTYETALAFVKGKRACVDPNSGFARTLVKWEAICRRPEPQRRFTS